MIDFINYLYQQIDEVTLKVNQLISN